MVFSPSETFTTAFLTNEPASSGRIDRIKKIKAPGKINNRILNILDNTSTTSLGSRFSRLNSAGFSQDEKQY